MDLKAVTETLPRLRIRYEIDSLGIASASAFVALFNLNERRRVLWLNDCRVRHVGTLGLENSQTPCTRRFIGLRFTAGRRGPLHDFSCLDIRLALLGYHVLLLYMVSFYLYFPVLQFFHQFFSSLTFFYLSHSFSFLLVVRFTFISTRMPEVSRSLRFC